MLTKEGKPKAGGNGAVTIIGPGVRIEGDVHFSGYLRVQGEVVGNILCDDNSQCTTVVHGAGSVTGSISSPNIVVGGRVVGPLRATGSVEVHRGASVQGDVQYRQLSIHEGGFIDGQLKRIADADKGEARRERRVARSESPDIKTLDGPHSHERRASDRSWPLFKIAIVVLVIIAAAWWLWPSSKKAAKVSTPAVVEQPSAPASLPDPVPTQPVPEAPKAAEPAPEPKPKPAAKPEPKPEPAPAPAPAPRVENKPAEPVLRAADPNRVTSVQGLDTAKQSDVFFVATREPAVLFKKARTDPGEGTRIDLTSGAKRRFYVSTDELVRVAQGNNLDIYFQGRKLSPAMIRSGDWLHFVPLVDTKPATPASTSTPAATATPVQAPKPAVQ